MQLHITEDLFLVPGIAAEIRQVIGKKSRGMIFLYDRLKMALDDRELGKLKSLF